MLSDTDIDAIEGLGWRIVEDGDLVELQMSTPAGEDWWVSVAEGGCSHERLVGELALHLESFDVREEFALFAGSMGRRGVPDDPVLLIADQYWKGARLSELCRTLANADSDLGNPQWSNAYEALRSAALRMKQS